MKKIKILTIALIFTLGSMLCQDVYALRVPIRQEYEHIKKAMTSYGEVDIRIVSPKEYDKYAGIFYEILAEEIGIWKDTAERGKAINTSFDTVAEFYRMARRLKSKKSKILALFIVTGREEKVIGASLHYKPQYLEELGLKAVKGIDAVRQEYQRKGIGSALRKTVFEWLMDKERMREEDYNKYAAVIHNKNLASLGNFEKVCDDLGLVLKPTSVFADPKEKYQYYLIDLASKQGVGNEFLAVLQEISNFGPQGHPSRASNVRRDLVAAIYPKAVSAISGFIKGAYPDVNTENLGVAITIQGSTAKGLAMDDSDLEIRLLIDDTDLGVKLEAKHKQEIIKLVLNLLNETMDSEKLKVRRFSLKMDRTHKVTFISEILDNPLRGRYVKAIADIFYTNIGDIESMRSKVLEAIVSLDDSEKKWNQIRNQWNGFLRVSFNKHKDRIDPKDVSIEFLELPDLRAMCRIYNLVSEQGVEWDSAWGEPTEEAMEIAQLYMKHWDASITSNAISASERFENQIGSSFRVESQTTLDVFKAILKINFDWGVAIIASAMDYKHHTVDWLFTKDYDKPYVAAAVDRAIELIENKSPVRCIKKQFNIDYNVNMLINAYLQMNGPEIEAILLNNLKDKSAAFFINNYHSLFRKDRDFPEEYDMQKKFFNDGVIIKKRGVVDFLTPEARDWLGLSEIGLPSNEARQGT